jgi:hypothetical protein
MEYLKNLIELHGSASELLEKMVSLKVQIGVLENSQKEFKKTFGKTSPQFANEILIGHRKIKMLSRSYAKILNKIKF